MSEPLSLGQGVLCGAIAIFVTILLLIVWQLTAEYSWSSDAWVMAIPALIIGAGMLAIGALAIRFAVKFTSRDE